MVMMIRSIFKTEGAFTLSIVLIIFAPFTFSKLPNQTKGSVKIKAKRFFETEDSSRMFKDISFSHMGGYESSSFCPQNERSYVSGARIRVSTFLNQTYPTVNAIELVCSDGIQSSVRADEVLLLQKNIGSWTETKECPLGGFVTGITLYTQLVSFELIAGNFIKSSVRDDIQLLNPNRFLDLFKLGRNTYVSGLTLNCTYNQNDNGFDWNAVRVNAKTFMNPKMKQLWRNTITLGRVSEMGVRLFCNESRVMTGISVTLEALITYEDGERWIPTDISTKCRTVKNPIKTCFPQLEWERINELNKTCHSVETGNTSSSSASSSSSYPVNVTCHIAHFTGLTPNKDIENLDKILQAYDAVKLEGIETRMFLMSKLYTLQFQRVWHRKYKLSIDDFFQTVVHKPENTYLYLGNDTHVVNFTNVDYNEPEYSKLIRNQTTEPLKHEFSIKQLVGYCSIYKIYFPLFKSEFQMYFERTIDGVKHRIIFPTVLDNAIIENAVESKLGMKISL